VTGSRALGSLLYSGRVRALVQSLADRAAQLGGIRSAFVPDLGPATLMDQLTVMVYDVSASSVPSKLEEDLASLRRQLV